jgi:hypothetical protein
MESLPAGFVGEECRLPYFHFRRAASQTRGAARSSQWVSRCLLISLALLLVDCIFFDSSHWGQAKQSQRSAAQQITPKALKPGSAKPADDEGTESANRSSTSAARVLTLRVHVTPRYAATNVDWQRRFALTLEDANRVFMPTFGARLEMLEPLSWEPADSEDHLDALLKELHGLDPGDDVDWVIGLAAAGPRVELAFHQLGLADLGKHLMLRAMSNAAEYQAIQTDFTELEEEERTKLYHARLQHKATTVFLHELGHTLGAIHERGAGSIMNSQYDTKAVTFSAETVQLMQLTMQYRRPGQRWSGGESWARGVLDVLERTPGSWIVADRDNMIARLKQVLATPAKPPMVATISSSSGNVALFPQGASAPLLRSSSTGSNVAKTSTGLETLSSSDRVRFDEALKEQQAGRSREAWLKAEPLFSAYSTVEAVQDLRCKLAMQQMGWEQARAECAALMQLTPGLRSKDGAHSTSK